MGRGHARRFVASCAVAGSAIGCTSSGGVTTHLDDGGRDATRGMTTTGGADAAGGTATMGGAGGAPAAGGTNAAGGRTTAGGASGATTGGKGGASSGGAADGAAPDSGSGGGLPGPLRVSDNPHYFADRDGHALVLAGSHTWNDLQDWGSGSTPEPFDFAAFADFLVAHGHNFTLLWRTELPKFCGLPTLDSNAPDLVTSPEPWPRTGPGKANDGLPKFDLSKFDPAYFERLRARVATLNEKGIWVGVYLFTGEWLNVYRCGSGDGYPLSGANNVNSIDDGGGNGSMDMSAPNAITAVQDAMVDKTIDALNDLPNVLWIVSEEAAASTAWWQSHMIAHVRAYEKTKPAQHPIGLAAITGAPDQSVYDSDADWVAPFAKVSPSDTCGAGTPRCKVNLNDSDHSYFGMWNDSAQANRQYAWENFARGNQVAFMDPYTVYYPRQSRNMCASPKNAMCGAPDTRWDGFRDNLGYILRYSRRMNLNKANPSSTLCSTTFCLGQTGATGTEVLVYAPTGGAVTVNLGVATGRSMNYEWFDPATGMVAEQGSVAGGKAQQSFTTPASVKTDAVLYIVDSAGHG